MKIYLDTQIEDTLRGIQDYTFNDYQGYMNEGDDFCAKARLDEMTALYIMEDWLYDRTAAEELTISTTYTGIKPVEHIRNIIDYSRCMHEDPGDQWYIDAVVLRLMLDAMMKEVKR